MWSRAAVQEFTNLLQESPEIITQSFAQFGSCQLVDLVGLSSILKMKNLKKNLFALLLIQEQVICHQYYR